MMALVYVLYRTSGYTAKQVWGITKPLVLAFFLFFILNFPFAKPLEGERVFAYLFPGNKCPVTVATISSGFASAIRFIFFIWIADLITSATPTGDIVLTMNKAKLPPEASIAIGIAFSYIPVLKNEIGHVIEAQKSRGASFESKNPFKKIKAYIPVIVPGLFISILKGREIARTIEARGFTYNPEDIQKDHKAQDQRLCDHHAVNIAHDSSIVFEAFPRMVRRYLYSQLVRQVMPPISRRPATFSGSAVGKSANKKSANI